MGGLVHTVSPGAPQWDSSPEDQGWTLTMAGGNSGGRREALPRSAGQGSGGLLGWFRPLKFQVSEGRNREQPQKLGRSQMTRTEAQGPSRPLSQADMSSLPPLTKGGGVQGWSREGAAGACAPAVGSGAPEDRKADSGRKCGWGPFSSAGRGVRMNFGPIYQHFLRTSEALALGSAHTDHHDRE